MTCIAIKVRILDYFDYLIDKLFFQTLNKNGRQFFSANIE